MDGIILVSPRMRTADVLAATGRDADRGRRAPAARRERRLDPRRRGGRRAAGRASTSRTSATGGSPTSTAAAARARRRGARATSGRCAALGLGGHAVVVAGDFTEEAGVHGRRGAARGGDPLPTAVFAANDLVAAGRARPAGGRGRPVPDDVSIVGYDNTFLAALHHMSLTTVDQPRHEMGRLALGAAARADRRAHEAGGPADGAAAGGAQDVRPGAAMTRLAACVAVALLAASAIAHATGAAPAGTALVTVGAAPGGIATGFTVAPGRVVTVAHVSTPPAPARPPPPTPPPPGPAARRPPTPIPAPGARRGPVAVRGSDGVARRATVVRRDARLDLALLSVPGLPAAPVTPARRDSCSSAATARWPRARPRAPDHRRRIRGGHRPRSRGGPRWSSPRPPAPATPARP